MNWVDLRVIGLAVLAAVSGARQGVIIALPAFIGVLLGGVLGILIAPLVVEQISASPTKVAFAFAIFVLFIALGETLGVWVGRTVRQKINSPKLSGVDSVLGAVVQGLVVFVVAWLTGSALSTVGNLPGLASAINRSVVLGGPGLSAPTMRFAGQGGTSGQDSIVLGYPLDGPYTAAPSRIRDRISLSGPNIYGSRTVTRDVFTLRAVVKSGNSGGPLVDT